MNTWPGNLKRLRHKLAGHHGIDLISPAMALGTAMRSFPEMASRRAKFSRGYYLASPICESKMLRSYLPRPQLWIVIYPSTIVSSSESISPYMAGLLSWSRGSAASLTVDSFPCIDPICLFSFRMPSRGALAVSINNYIFGTNSLASPLLARCYYWPLIMCARPLSLHSPVLFPCEC